MLDTIVQRLSQQAADVPGNSGLGMEDEDMVGSLLVGKGSGLPLVAGEEGLSYFTAPICDLFVTLFELKEKNNWLRRQAILIILQQILGGTIERYVVSNSWPAGKQPNFSCTQGNFEMLSKW